MSLINTMEPWKEGGMVMRWPELRIFTLELQRDESLSIDDAKVITHLTTMDSINIADAAIRKMMGKL